MTIRQSGLSIPERIYRLHGILTAPKGDIRGNIESTLLKGGV